MASNRRPQRRNRCGNHSLAERNGLLVVVQNQASTNRSPQAFARWRMPEKSLLETVAVADNPAAPVFNHDIDLTLSRKWRMYTGHRTRERKFAEHEGLQYPPNGVRRGAGDCL